MQTTDASKMENLYTLGWQISLSLLFGSFDQNWPFWPLGGTDAFSKLGKLEVSSLGIKGEEI